MKGEKNKLFNIINNMSSYSVNQNKLVFNLKYLSTESSEYSKTINLPKNISDEKVEGIMINICQKINKMIRDEIKEDILNAGEELLSNHNEIRDNVEEGTKIISSSRNSNTIEIMNQVDNNSGSKSNIPKKSNNSKSSILEEILKKGDGINTMKELAQKKLFTNGKIKKMEISKYGLSGEKVVLSDKDDMNKIIKQLLMFFHK